MEGKIPVPNNLEVVIDGALAVDLEWLLVAHMQCGIPPGRAVELEVKLITAINKALTRAGLPIVEEGGAFPTTEK